MSRLCLPGCCYLAEAHHKLSQRTSTSYNKSCYISLCDLEKKTSNKRNMVDHHATVTYVVESCHNAARTSRMTQSLVNPSSSWRVGPAGTLVLRWLRILPFQLQPHRCQNSRYTSGTSSELASWPETKKTNKSSFGIIHPLHLLPKFRLYHAYTISVELVVSKGDGVFSHRFLFPSSCTLDPSFPGRLPMHPAVLRSAWKPEKRPEFLILFPMMEFSKVRVSIFNDAYNIYSKAKSWILLTFT